MATFNDIHLQQLETIPRIFWSSLKEKLENDVFDAGNYFSLSIDGNNEYHALVTVQDGVKKLDPKNVFLIDHAWTYEAEHAEAILRQYPSLLKRMADLMSIEFDEQESSNIPSHVIAKILKNMWKYNASYFMKKTVVVDGEEINDSEDIDYTPLWYILDEFGSRIQHSDSPNVVFKRFYHVPKKLSVTIMYPVKDLNHGDEICRNYIENVVGDADTKDGRLYPWLNDKLNIENIKDDWTVKLMKINNEIDRCDEIVATDSTSQNNINNEPNTDKILKVFTTNNFVTKHLTNERFELIDNEQDADIIFAATHFKDFLSSQHQYLSQFPNEKILVCKDCFAETGMRSVIYKYKDCTIPEEILENRGPLWLPTTFNLFTELPQFIKYFKNRENNKDVDNTWIVKPWNLARSLDHTVTSNLSHIIRLAETGPKVVCKYLDNPVLYLRKDIGWVKQDYRFVVYVTNADPLQVYIHKVFWIRFGNKAFELQDFYNFQKHYTHMWYGGCELLEVPYEQYMEKFNDMYPQLNWTNIQKDIYSCIKEQFVGATTEAPPHGLGRTNKSRAFYGIDLMLRWKDKHHTAVQPVLLEANFNSDITRACRDMPDFVNEMFELFFLNQISDNFIKL